MTSYDDTKVQLTINRMTQKCYDSLSGVSTKELYLISENLNGVAKIDLDAQGAIESEISALSAQTIERFSQIGNDISALSAWDTTQDSLISELSTQTISNSTDISALIVEIQEVSANMSKSIIRRWEPVAQGLRFVAEEANSTVAMTAVGSAPSVSLEYNTGDGWNDFVVGTTTVTLANVGDECFIRAKTANTVMGSSSSNYNKFNMTGKIAASGSIMYLLKNDGDLDTIPSDYCFSNLFYNCRSLTTPPELPATTMTTECYRLMFYGCSSLTEAPVLPATTLASSCYRSMFQNCTSLTQVPDLSATTLAGNCCQHMFYGCTSLSSMPELPSTSLSPYCYYGMFIGCSSLVDVDDLPATTLEQGCYGYMFQNCTSLTTAPELPASAMVRECYQGMFQNDSSLSEIKIGYTGNFGDAPLTSFQNWVDGVSASGTFYYDGTDTTTGNSAIPTGWTVKSMVDGLKFTANTAGSTLKIVKKGSAPTLYLAYSTDGSTWNTYNAGNTITLANQGDSVWMKATQTNNKTAYNWSEDNINQFVMTGSIACSGDISWLRSPQGTPDSSLPDYCYMGLFQDCTALTSAPDIPATSIGVTSYGGMFRNTGITAAPEFHVTSFASGGYSCSNMFAECQYLTTPPPDLPATYLATYAYNGMFRDCPLLTKSPHIKATSFATYAFIDMFKNDTSLSEIKIDYTGNFSSTYFSNWVNGVQTSSGTFYYNGSDRTTGTSAIPANWTIQTF